MSTAAPEQQIDPLRLEMCPNCGYCLTGLPAEGICPECGKHYAPGQIILYGWGYTLSTCGGVGLILRIAIGTALAFGLVLAGLQMTVKLLQAGYLVLGGSTFLCLVIQLAGRWDSPFPGPVQVRFSPLGSQQLDNPEQSWCFRVLVRTAWYMLLPAGILCLFISLAWGPAGTFSEIGVLELLGLTFSFIVATFVVAPRAMNAERWIPWSQTPEIRFDIQGSNGYMKVRLGHRTSQDEDNSWRWDVNAIVICSAEQREAIVRQVHQWREG